MDFLSGLKAYAERVEQRLSELLPPSEQVPEVLSEAMRYACLAPGKRLRPALCMAACAAVGGDPERALDAACALEMVHCFSLIHDDLPAIDNDDLRRGLPTVHIQFGEAVAILAGDALFALAFEIVAEEGGWAAVLLARTSGIRGLVGGEMLDILSEGAEPSAELLEKIHHGKTASLIACSCEMGARIGGGTTEQIEAMRVYGHEVGLAFQIADDVLNETATEAALGKAAGSDAARGKMTYPRVFGLEVSRSLMFACVDRALQGLGNMPGETQFLRDLALFSVERDR